MFYILPITTSPVSLKLGPFQMDLSFNSMIPIDVKSITIILNQSKLECPTHKGMNINRCTRQMLIIYAKSCHSIVLIMSLNT